LAGEPVAFWSTGFSSVAFGGGPCWWPLILGGAWRLIPLLILASCRSVRALLLGGRWMELGLCFGGLDDAVGALCSDLRGSWNRLGAGIEGGRPEAV
jgi:hypothetical protein